MQAKRKPKLPASSIEQRESKRRAVNLSGDLIVPSEKIILPCRVSNLSKGGASIRCKQPLPPHTYVILCMDGFGRLEGLTKRSAGGEVGLQFVVKKTSQSHVLDEIRSRASDGSVRKAGLRRHVRLPSLSKVRFTLKGGEEVSSEVIDVSMRGLCLRTRARPAINDPICIGGKSGRVVRHHSEGIAVEFGT